MLRIHQGDHNNNSVAAAMDCSFIGLTGNLPSFGWIAGQVSGHAEQDCYQAATDQQTQR